MSSAEEQQLPEATCTGPGGGQTAMDRLLSTVPSSSQQWLWIPARLMRQWRPKKNRPTIFFCGMLSELDNFFSAGLISLISKMVVLSNSD